MKSIGAIATSVVGTIIAFVVMFFLVSNLAPTLIQSSGNISASGLPLASLFASGGLVMLLFMIGLLIKSIVLAMRK